MALSMTQSFPVRLIVVVLFLRGAFPEEVSLPVKSLLHSTGRQRQHFLESLGMLIIESEALPIVSRVTVVAPPTTTTTTTTRGNPKPGRIKILGEPKYKTIFSDPNTANSDAKSEVINPEPKRASTLEKLKTEDSNTTPLNTRLFPRFRREKVLMRGEGNPKITEKRRDIKQQKWRSKTFVPEKVSSEDSLSEEGKHLQRGRTVVRPSYIGEKKAFLPHSDRMPKESEKYHWARNQRREPVTTEDTLYMVPSEEQVMMAQEVQQVSHVITGRLQPSPSGHSYDEKQEIGFHDGKGKIAKRGHEDSKGYKGKHNKGHGKKKKSDYADAGGKKLKGKELKGTYHADNKSEKKGAKGHSYGKKGHRNKGHSNKGYKNISHKEEYHVTKKFYDDANDSDFHEKYDDFDSYFKAAEGGSRKGKSFEANRAHDNRRKKNLHKESKFFDDYSDHNSDYAKKGHYTESSKHGHKGHFKKGHTSGGSNKGHGGGSSKIHGGYDGHGGHGGDYARGSHSENSVRQLRMDEGKDKLYDDQQNRPEYQREESRNRLYEDRQYRPQNRRDDDGYRVYDNEGNRPTQKYISLLNHPEALTNSESFAPQREERRDGIEDRDRQYLHPFQRKGESEYRKSSSSIPENVIIYERPRHKYREEDLYRKEVKPGYPLTARLLKLLELLPELEVLEKIQNFVKSQTQSPSFSPSRETTTTEAFTTETIRTTTTELNEKLTTATTTQPSLSTTTNEQRTTTIIPPPRTTTTTQTATRKPIQATINNLTTITTVQTPTTSTTSEKTMNVTTTTIEVESTLENIMNKPTTKMTSEKPTPTISAFNETTTETTTGFLFTTETTTKKPVIKTTAKQKIQTKITTKKSKSQNSKASLPIESRIRIVSQYGDSVENKTETSVPEVVNCTNSSNNCATSTKESRSSYAMKNVDSDDEIDIPVANISFHGPTADQNATANEQNPDQTKNETVTTLDVEKVSILEEDRKNGSGYVGLKVFTLAGNDSRGETETKLTGNQKETVTSDSLVSETELGMNAFDSSSSDNSLSNVTTEVKEEKIATETVKKLNVKKPKRKSLKIVKNIRVLVNPNNVTNEKNNPKPSTKTKKEENEQKRSRRKIKAHEENVINKSGKNKRDKNAENNNTKLQKKPDRYSLKTLSLGTRMSIPSTWPLI